MCLGVVLAIPARNYFEKPAWDVRIYLQGVDSVRAGHDPYADAIAVQRLYHDHRELFPARDVYKRQTVTRVMSVDLHIGSRLPAFCTSMGRILLAYLPQDQLEAYLARVQLTPYTPKTINSVDKLRLALRNVRRNGYALCDQEYEIGLRSIAVPVYAGNGRAVATVNLSGHAPRMPMLEMQTRFLPPLRAAAAELSVFLR